MALGVNPNYVFGSELLVEIALQSKKDKIVKIPIDTDFNTKLSCMDGVDGGDLFRERMRCTRRILERDSPDKVIVFGEDCSVTQVPFDYLSNKYDGNIGIIWLDAHPDIAVFTSARDGTGQLAGTKSDLRDNEGKPPLCAGKGSFGRVD